MKINGNENDGEKYGEQDTNQRALASRNCLPLRSEGEHMNTLRTPHPRH